MEWSEVANGNCSENITGPMGSGWVYDAFGQCIGDVKQWIAFGIGLSSILCWMLAQAPQLITNCYTGRADQVLSFWFLLQWIIGDSTNLVGSLLTGQLFTQIATAVYFVLIDCLSLTQFVYHLLRNQGIKGLTSCFKDKPPVLAALLPGLMFTVFLVSHNRLMWRDPYQTGHRVGRTLKQIDVVDVNDPKDIAGYVLGCISAMFYVMSRVPQIVKNCRRCSVEGLSPVMFVLAILGNVTYGLGIFLYSVDPVFLLQKLPWLVGSVGTLFFDFTIMTQFVVSWVVRCRRRSKTPIEDGEQEPLLPNTPVKDSCCYHVLRTTSRTAHDHSSYTVKFYKNTPPIDKEQSSSF